jgi:transposase
MSKPMVTDDLWAAVRPLIPRHEASAKGGHPPVDDRVCLTGILFVLKTGIAWEDFPCEMGCSGMTLLNRLRAWQRAGVWAATHRAMLARLRAAGVIDLSRVVVDSGSVRAMHGGKKRGRAPWTAGKTAPSTTSPSTRAGCRSRRR